jgi:hypothetical protein
MATRTLLGLLVLAVASAGGSTATGAAVLEPDDLYASVAPAIAFIQTPTATGSGILIDAEHVLTNAHVVGHFETVRVHFPGGVEFREATVVAWDRLADMALVRVPRVEIAPVRVADARLLRPGSRLYLLGYPGERDAKPQPTIMQGLLSRVRQGGPAGLTYIQTDAPAEQGNSGGAVISVSGEVVAVTQLRLPNTTFTLGASASEAVARMRSLAQGAVDQFGERRLSSLAAPIGTPYAFTLEGVYADQAFLVAGGERRNVVVEVQGAAARLDAYDFGGRHVDNGIPFGPGRLVMQLLAEPGQRYVVVVRQASASREQFVIVASEAIAELRDPDRGAVLPFGVPHAGVLPYKGARQYFFVDLSAGQTVAVAASSLAVDSFVAIDRSEHDGGPLAIDDDSGGGLLAHDAVATYTAEQTGRYLVSLRDTAGTNDGGYLIAAHLAAPPVSAPGAGTILTRAPATGGLELVVFGGGASDDLAPALDCPQEALQVWATDRGGRLVVFVPAATVEAVNAEWESLFPFGIPAGMALLVRCESEAA